MAKIVIELPRDWETEQIVINQSKNQIIIDPQFQARSNMAVLLYITAEGRSGAKRRGVLKFNGNTGWPEVHRVRMDKNQACPFDEVSQEDLQAEEIQADEQPDDE